MSFTQSIPSLTIALLLWAQPPRAAAQTDLSGQTADSIRNVLSLVARHQINYFGSLQDGNYASAMTLTAATNATKPTGLGWSYPWGVTLYGVLRASEATGETDARDYVLNHNLVLGRSFAWLQSLNLTVTNATPAQILAYQKSAPTIGTLFNLRDLDSCGAMGSQFMEGILKFSGPAASGQTEIGTAIATYIGTNYPGSHQQRLADGTLCRSTYNGSVWGDDLYMSCPFLIRWAQFTNDTRFFNDAASQVITMASRLQDTNGVFWHAFYFGSTGYNGYTNTHSPIKWGRANGWIMVSTVEILSAMPTNHPARPQLLDILQRHIAGIQPLQSPAGMWYQVLDDGANPSNWEETSCTAMFTYCIARAVNRGWIDATNMASAHRAFVAICRHIDSNGAVNGTCEGTDIGTTASYYFGRNHTSNKDDQHGRGPVLLAGAEILLSRVAPPPPELTVAQVGAQTVISWSAALTNYTLQVTSKLPGGWTNFAGSPVVHNGQFTATNLLAANQFYRLRFTPATIPLPDDILYRETFGTDVTGAQGAAQAYDWALHHGATAANASANTDASGSINRNTGASKPGMTDPVGQVNAGPVIGALPTAYGTGVAFAAATKGAVIFWTPEFSNWSGFALDPAAYASLQFSWYQGCGDTTGNWRVAVRVANQWYVSQHSFNNTAAVNGVVNFYLGDDSGNGGSSHGAELKTFTFSHTASTWLRLNFNGSFSPATHTGAAGTVLSMGAQPNSDLAGTIDAFGLFSDVSGAQNRRFDSFQITGTLLP